MLTCRICGERVLEEVFPAHVQGHLRDDFEALTALTTDSTAVKDAISPEQFLPWEECKVHEEEKVITLDEWEDVFPKALWIAPKEEPEKTVDLNEVIPYRIKARQEHEALMEAHHDREAIEANDKDWEVHTRLEMILYDIWDGETEHLTDTPQPEPKRGG